MALYVEALCHCCYWDGSCSMDRGCCWWKLYNKKKKKRKRWNREDIWNITRWRLFAVQPYEGSIWRWWMEAEGKGDSFGVVNNSATASGGARVPGKASITLEWSWTSVGSQRTLQWWGRCCRGTQQIVVFTPSFSRYWLPSRWWSDFIWRAYYTGKFVSRVFNLFHLQRHQLLIKQWFGWNRWLSLDTHNI